jgi:Bacterial regulatory proteins, luxR family
VTLGISESTVNWHLANAFERLGASSRAEAVALSIRSNGGAAAPAPVPAVQQVPATPPSIAWPRLVAIAIAIAIAGALLGGATVATFHIGQPPAATEVPPTGSSGTATSTPENSSSPSIAVDEKGPAATPSDAASDAVPVLQQPVSSTRAPLPALSAPPLPAVPVTLPTSVPATPPVTPPALPTPSLPPLPIPVPTLPIP